MHIFPRSQVEILQAAGAGSRRGAAAPRGGRGRDAEGAGAEGEAEPGGEGGWADGRMGLGVGMCLGKNMEKDGDDSI